MVNIDVMIRVKGRISKTNIQTSSGFMVIRDPCILKKTEPHYNPAQMREIKMKWESEQVPDNFCVQTHARRVK